VEALLAGDLLRVDLGSTHRCLASTVLGGGLGAVRTWVNLRVPSDYARTDPGAHLAEVAAGLPGPVVGMLTAAALEGFQDVTRGSARAFATVGLGHPVAAAGRRDLLPWARPGTINIFVVTEAPLTDAALAGALQTAVEGKVQALTEAGIGARNTTGLATGRGLATGTASDAIAIACVPGASVPFAGSATEVGHDLARAVWTVVSKGIEVWGRHGP
jgi:adenosylcobinamide amidohydrolase